MIPSPPGKKGEEEKGDPEGRDEEIRPEEVEALGRWGDGEERGGLKYFFTASDGDFDLPETGCAENDGRTVEESIGGIGVGGGDGWGNRWKGGGRTRGVDDRTTETIGGAEDGAGRREKTEGDRGVEDYGLGGGLLDEQGEIGGEIFGEIGWRKKGECEGPLGRLKAKDTAIGASGGEAKRRVKNPADQVKEPSEKAGSFHRNKSLIPRIAMG